MVTAYFVEPPRPGGVFATLEILEVRKLLEQKLVTGVTYVRMMPAASERMRANTGSNTNSFDENRYYGPFRTWASAKFEGFVPSVPSELFVLPIPNVVNVTVFRPAPRDNFVDLLQTDPTTEDEN